MKELLLLLDNHTITRMKETKLSKRDIRDVEYLFIPISDNGLNYIPIKPTQLLLFHKAVIDYQLCVLYQNDYTDLTVEEMTPVHFETESISDLIGLINSAEKVNVANILLNENSRWEGTEVDIGVCFFSVVLYNEKNQEIYNSYYELKGISSKAYDSYQVSKHFKDLYDSTLCSKYYCKNKHFYFDYNGEDVSWTLTNHNASHYSFIGIPSSNSASITLCTKGQYEKLLTYDTIDLHFCVYYEKNSFIEKMSMMINEGYTYQEREELKENIGDVYYDEERTYSSTINSISQLLDILSYSSFIFNTIYLMFRDVMYPVNNESDDEKNYDFDSIITIRLLTNKHTGKEFTLNRFNVISLNSILANI